MVKRQRAEEDELAGLMNCCCGGKSANTRGMACIAGTRVGGRGVSAIEQVLESKEAKYNVPAGFFVIGQGWQHRH